jgi:hypothetical protein
MRVSKSTCPVLVGVVTVLTLSATAFTGGHGSTLPQREARGTNGPIFERRDRYPVVEADEEEPKDPVKSAKLKKQKKHYDKDAPFGQFGPRDKEVSFLPEWQFDFPAFPVAKSDVIVIGEVLNAEAHRSENKRNVFSNFQIRVEEVLKGSNLTTGSLINVQRIGGIVKFPNGQEVLFSLAANGMPVVGARYAFFLNLIDEEDYRILTGYELGESVEPLDYSSQFQAYQGTNKTAFLTALRKTISQSVPQ